MLQTAVCCFFILDSNYLNKSCIILKRCTFSFSNLKNVSGCQMELFKMVLKSVRLKSDGMAIPQTSIKTGESTWKLLLGHIFSMHCHTFFRLFCPFCNVHEMNTLWRAFVVSVTYKKQYSSELRVCTASCWLYWILVPTELLQNLLQ
jgi:hypothetical protein